MIGDEQGAVDREASADAATNVVGEDHPGTEVVASQRQQAHVQEVEHQASEAARRASQVPRLAADRPESGDGTS